MDHPSGCHDAGGDGGDDDVADNLRGADVSAGVDGKGRVWPIRMNLRKISKQPLTPPPHFWKIILQFFWENVRKNLYKGPKSAIRNFGLKMTIPPFELFRKFIRIGSASLPLWSTDNSASAYFKV